MRAPIRIVAAALLSALVGAQAFASPGTISRSATLRAHPSAAAKAIAELPKGTDVEIKARRGFWLQDLSSESGTTRGGWGKFIRVRQASRGSAASSGGPAKKSSGSSSSGGFFSSLSRGATGLFGGRRDTRPQSTTTIGIRGLSANDLKTSGENRNELTKLDAITPSERAISRFARKGKLQTHELAYIDPASANVAQSGSEERSGNDGNESNSSGGISGLWRGIAGGGSEDASRSTDESAESGSGGGIKSLFGGFTSGSSDTESNQDSQGGSD
jgi:hypothetical protein